MPGDRRSLTVGQPWSELLEATAHGASTLPPTCLANGQQGRVTQRAVTPINRAACVILWLADLRSRAGGHAIKLCKRIQGQGRELKVKAGHEGAANEQQSLLYHHF